MNEKIAAIIASFALETGSVEAAPYGNGHINDTLCVIVHAQEGDKRYILQRVNSYVFPKPEEVIQNIEKVTAYLREIIVKEGGDPQRETLTLMETKDGKHHVIAEDGELWRMYRNEVRRSAGYAGAVCAFRPRVWQVPAAAGRL